MSIKYCISFLHEDFQLSEREYKYYTKFCIKSHNFRIENKKIVLYTLELDPEINAKDFKRFLKISRGRIPHFDKYSKVKLISICEIARKYGFNETNFPFNTINSYINKK